MRIRVFPVDKLANEKTREGGVQPTPILVNQTDIITNKEERHSGYN
jgi:hypothetical protein